MTHPAERTLAHLEQCEPKNDPWRAYIRDRVAEAKEWITTLRDMANKDPETAVAHNCNQMADTLQARVDALLKEVTRD